MKKISLKKVLALGATSVAFIGGLVTTGSHKKVEAASSITVLKLKHNAYKYNSNGKRIGKGYLAKGSSYYSKGAYKIHGKKYHKLKTKGNIYVKDGNLNITVLRDQVTLSHNSYLYNSTGRKIKGFKALKAGDTYFVWGTRKIMGRKYYELGDGQYVKGVNIINNDNSSTKTTTSNVNNTSNTNVTNNRTASSNNNSVQKPVAPTQNTNSSNNRPAVSSNSSQNKATSSPNNTATQKPATSNNKSYSKNYLYFPKGYFETVKNSNFGVTPLTNKLCQEGLEKNVFHSESKVDDEMRIDSANLTADQAFEINDFALRLINQARSQVGSKPWNYTENGQRVADRIAYLYEQDGMGLSTWHDQKALNQVDKEAGINSAELMGGGPVNDDRDMLHNMTDLKAAVYSDIVSMLFSTVELHHAQIMLTWNSVTSDMTSFGLSISWQKQNKYGKIEHSDHFIAY